MPPKARGRHRRREDLMKVWLQDSVYNLCNEKKGYRGFEKNTKSEFAEFLLHRTRLSSTVGCDDYKFEEATRSKFLLIARTSGKSVVFLVEVLCIYLVYQVVFFHNKVIIT